MIDWHVESAMLGPQAAEGFAALDRVFALEGEWVAASPISDVVRVSFDGIAYYVKRYKGVRYDGADRLAAVRSLLAGSRVRREGRNLAAFAAWGVRTPPLVAYGEERRAGRFRRGAIVTREAAGTVDLASLAAAGDARLRDRAWVAAVSAQVAAFTRTLHAHGFAHNDLKWRNILVDDGDQPRVWFIDCPFGRRWAGPFLRYRIVKDLACLDKIAKRQLSRTQRLRFYLDYAGHSRLAAADKSRIRKVLAFFRGRE